MTAIETLEPTTSQRELQERARRFVEDVLIPREEMAERAGGVLPPAEVDVIRRAAVDARLHGGLHAVEHGGQGWSHVEWCLVEEQLGRSTNGLSWHIPTAYNVLAHGSPEQIDRWLRPGLRGESQDAYAVTEEHAGSDPSGIATTAVRTDGGFRIDGEKWFVTSGDVASVYIVFANVVEAGERLPTLFLLERGTPGIEIVDDPPFTHAYPHGHPTVRFTGVEVPADAVLGAVGAGDDLQRAWFTEERLGIAARPRRDVAAARGGRRPWPAARAGRRADLRPPGRVVPPRRLRRRRRGGPRPDARGVRARRRAGGRPEARPRQGVDVQAVRLRARVGVRRPRGADVRRARLRAHERGRALPARAARRPHLGGHERDSAADRGALDGAARGAAAPALKSWTSRA